MGCPRLRSRRRAAATAVALALALATGGCGDLDGSELKNEVDAIGATAAEGRLLALQASRGRTKDSFVQVHAHELSKQVASSLQKITATPSVGVLRREIHDAVEIATGTADALNALRESPDNRLTAARAAAQLNERVSDAEDLSGEL